MQTLRTLPAYRWCGRELESSRAWRCTAAGLAAGVYASLDDIARLWRPEQRFAPAMSRERADARHAGWRNAVQRLRMAPPAHDP